MSYCLIKDYIDEIGNLDHIRAICHWASKEEKMKYLSVASIDSMIKFTNTVNNNATVNYRATRNNQSGLITHKFTQRLPYGNGFLVVFFEKDNKCIFSCKILIFRLS